jgi:hypothetical protein
MGGGVWEAQRLVVFEGSMLTKMFGFDEDVRV